MIYMTVWGVAGQSTHSRTVLGKEFIMDTKSLDKQDKAHLQIYQNFMFAAKISIIAIIATLVIMAATLI